MQKIQQNQQNAQ
jgi:hypothetical protein